MNLDLRTPMGLMFSITGAILVIWGLKTNGDAIYARSLGINANLWWGIVLLIFGLTMFILGERRQHKLEEEPPDHRRNGDPPRPRPLESRELPSPASRKPNQHPSQNRYPRADDYERARLCKPCRPHRPRKSTRKSRIALRASGWFADAEPPLLRS